MNENTIDENTINESTVDDNAMDESAVIQNAIPESTVVENATDETTMDDNRRRRPRNVHTKHLEEKDRARIRTLFYDARMPRAAIVRLTGYTTAQVKYSVKAESAAVKPRSGRRPRDPSSRPVGQPAARRRARPVSQPSTAQPVAAWPVATQPVTAQPPAVWPVAPQPGSDQLVAAQSAAVWPVATQSVAAHSVAAHPAAAWPITPQPVSIQPGAAHPGAVQSAVQSVTSSREGSTTTNSSLASEHDESTQQVRESPNTTNTASNPTNLRYRDASTQAGLDVLGMFLGWPEGAWRNVRWRT